MPPVLALLLMLCSGDFEEIFPFPSRQRNLPLGPQYRACGEESTVEICNINQDIENGAKKGAAQSKAMETSQLVACSAVQ